MCRFFRKGNRKLKKQLRVYGTPDVTLERCDVKSTEIWRQVIEETQNSEEEQTTGTWDEWEIERVRGLFYTQ